MRFPYVTGCCTILLLAYVADAKLQNDIMTHEKGEALRTNEACEFLPNLQGPLGYGFHVEVISYSFAYSNAGSYGKTHREIANYWCQVCFR
jgi:hypothetical protein